MSYHRFTNLSEAFAGYIVSKWNKNIISKDSKDLTCNYNVSSIIDGKCVFNIGCRKSVVIYKDMCKAAG